MGALRSYSIPPLNVAAGGRQKRPKSRTQVARQYLLSVFFDSLRRDRGSVAAGYVAIAIYKEFGEVPLNGLGAE
jgi:hypothetical protein